MVKLKFPILVHVDVLKKMGIENVATGIGGGFTLDYITAGLTEKGISNNFLKVKEPTRINVFTRVIDQNREYKEVNPGPEVSEKVFVTDFL